MPTEPTASGPPIEGVVDQGGDTSGAGKFIVEGAVAAPLYGIPYAGPALAGVASSAAGQGYDYLLGKQEGFDTGLFAKDAAVNAGLGYGLKGLYYGAKGAKGLVDVYKGKPIAEELYQGALKPSTALKQSQVKERVQTGIREGVEVSEKGLGKLRNTVDSINTEIDGMIANATEQGGTVSKSALTDALLKMRNEKTASNLVGYRDYKDTIDKVIAEIGEHPSGELMSVGQAQEFKKNIYGLIRKSYENAKKLGAQTMDPVTNQAYKKVASTLRQEIETAVPEIRMLNNRERQLLNLQDSLERAVGRINNWDLIGLSEPLVGVMLGGGSTATRVTATVGAKVLKSPAIRSKIAMSLSRNKIPLSEASRAALGIARD